MTGEASDDGRRQRIASRFGAAADGYEDHAGVQRAAARTVADLCALVALPPAPRLLEIGCGTGFLTRELPLRFPGAQMLVTDLAPEMVARAGRGAMIGATFLALDGERPGIEGAHFDLIASSLAFQWFDDLEGALARLAAMLRPGGSLIFSTMGAGSFAAWRAAHADCGVEAGVPDYPTLDGLRAMLARFPDAFAFDEVFALDTSDARGLAAHLKGIGAVVPAPGRAPLSAGAMRAVMRAFDRGGGRDVYQVLFGRVTRV